MPWLKIVALALAVAVARASVILDNPTQVVRRDPPAPSAYPLEDACDHEWQYLNFNPDDDTDKSRLEKLHDVICSGEMRTISSYGQLAAQSALVTYKRYFPESDDDDDTQGYVNDVLALIAGTSSTDGAIGTVVGTFVVDNLGKLPRLLAGIVSCVFSLSLSLFDSSCPLIHFADFAGNNPNEPDCTDEGTLGYTLTDELDDREKIHFCDPAYTRGKFTDVDCASLDPFPSTKMDTFSRIVLHEMTHSSSVGPDSSLENQIIDVKNTDGGFAYDPPRVHGLVDEDQDNQLALPENNADSYAWMALDTLISRDCSPPSTDDRWQDFFKEDPPPYEEED